MIAPAYITQWGAVAPWPPRAQVEQDLVLSRLIVEIANDPVLGPELAFRGGTCLHKLHLPAALRYSEDLDYVRRSHSGIKPYISALRAVIERVGLQVRGTTRSGEMIHFAAQAPAESAGMIVVKIEINIAEIDAILPRVARPFEVRSRWWNGGCEVATFAVEELMGTKLRALYQRRKGRDLFDLWHVLVTLAPDDELIARTMERYMGDGAFTFPQLRNNLRDKLDQPDFRADLSALVAEQPHGYDLVAAADLVMERIERHLRKAPSDAEIADGAWRERR